MHSIGVIGHSFSISIRTLTFVIPPLRNVTVADAIPSGGSRRRWRRYADPGKFKIQSSLNKPNNTNYPAVVLDSLRLVEWDKVSDSVASFAGTSLGREALKAQLWSLNQTYEESLKLLEETNAAVQMHKYGGCLIDFSCIDLTLVKSAIQHARRGMHVDGSEAIAVVALLEFAEALQSGIKAAVKEDADWYSRFMPLAEMIMDLVVNQSLVKFVRKVVDDDGSVKDSASSTLKQSRDQVRLLEKRLNQLMESLIRNEMKQTSSLEVSNIDGRWCLKSGSDMGTTFEGLWLSSGSGTGSFVEPLSAVPLNDELQQARATVAKAEANVLIMITNKMQTEIDDLDNLFNNMIKLDVINARATYSLSYKGACPHLFFPEDCDRLFTAQASSVNKTSMTYSATQKWTLYLPRAYHPLLLQQHRQSLQKAMQDLTDATAEIQRRKQGGNITVNDEENIDLMSLKMQVKRLEQAPPIPVDIFVAQKIKVLVITGPNTGGKTICLNTVGLAAIMAKSGLYVLCSDPAKIPWFDNVFADIGDEQSLSQSLSTFSGHLKQISEIQLHSTNRSLVLLDEVGAGTNPLEGAALGMSLLESFAAACVLLTIATTHHGELKTLKYSNDAFENACMEFDEVNLKPTYRILWGVPGRSNAINIAEKLGLSTIILDNARELYGAANVEINEVILDMEKLKRIFHEHIHEAQHYLMLSRYLDEKLLMARNRIIEHSHIQRSRKNQKVSEAAAEARSFLHKKVRQLCANAHLSVNSTVGNGQQKSAFDGQHGREKKTEIAVVTKSAYSSDNIGQPLSERRAKIPEEGDMVHVSSLNKKALVLKVEPSKGEIIVQVGNMKLKLLLVDVLTDR